MRGASTSASAPGSDGIDEERLLELDESGAGGIERLDLLPLLGVLALLLLAGRRQAVEQGVDLVYREDHRSAVGPGCA
eukprot:scaffold4312_cov30-Phaeocystis_antarctica.AAC.1